MTLSLPALANLVALDISPIGTVTYEAFTGTEVPPYLQSKIAGIDWIGTDEQPNLEKLALLKPDLILGLEKQHQQIYAQLSQIAPTVMLESDRAQWQQLFLEVAAVVGQTSEAEQLLQNYEQRVEALREALGEQGLEQEISVAYILGSDIYAEPQNSFAGSILQDVGLKRPPAQSVKVAANSRLIFSKERLDIIDGDVLFVPKSGSDLDDDQEAFMKTPLWQTLTAVQQGRVYRVNLWEWTGLDILAAHKVLNDLFQHLIDEPPS
ncbi:MAG: iron-siderophore ABC transporter substrate-binding protein [Leptolyngbya sp. SIO4C5]|nr:iron-siderophore ABC transporter substrate-binding protein [Leptolyngbya sp. SIO4C5]